MLIWSNYSTMHKRDEFDKDTIRRMHRSQIKGTAAPVAVLPVAYGHPREGGDPISSKRVPAFAGRRGLSSPSACAR